MPFRIEPVPVPRETRVNMDDATSDDRLVIVLESGQQMVFLVNPPFPLIECDLERSSPLLISAMAEALWDKRKRSRLALPFRGQALTMEKVISGLWILLTTGTKSPEVTVKKPLYVRLHTSGIQINMYEVPGGPVASITPTTVDQVPVIN